MLTHPIGTGLPPDRYRLLQRIVSDAAPGQGRPSPAARRPAPVASCPERRDRYAWVAVVAEAAAGGVVHARQWPAPADRFRGPA